MNMQISADGRLAHLLSLDGIPRALLLQLLDAADSLRSVALRGNKKLPLLRGRTIVNLFFEASTRTRITFELAAARLSADVVNLDVAASSTSKGESLLDTLATLEAMQCDMFVVRHPESGAAHFIAEHAKAGVAVLNAGDGRHAHPTQALLDAYTIRRHKQNFEGLTIAIVGDVLHSRVARSELRAFGILGAHELRVIGPRTLMPPAIEELGARVYTDMETGIADADVVITLRLQRERMRGAFLPSENEYYRQYGLTSERLKRCKPDCIVMHPGPMNRGVEIASEVADGPQSVILEQVSNGLAVRMAVMSHILGAQIPQLENAA